MKTLYLIVAVIAAFLLIGILNQMNPSGPPRPGLAKDAAHKPEVQKGLSVMAHKDFGASSEEPVWPGVQFTEVRAFAWPKDDDTKAVILENMTLKSGAINPVGAVLTPEQTKALISAVTGKSPDYLFKGCYEPHNAFVFYDAAKKPVAFVEICFTCFSHRITPKVTATRLDLVALAAIFDAQKLPMGVFPDLHSFKMRFDYELERIALGADK